MYDPRRRGRYEIAEVATVTRPSEIRGDLASGSDGRDQTATDMLRAYRERDAEQLEQKHDRSGSGG